MRRIALFSILLVSAALSVPGAFGRTDAPGDAAATESRPAPDWFAHRDEQPDAARESAATVGPRVITSHLKATPERALRDARENLSHAVGDWLAQVGIPRSWVPKKPLVDALVMESYVEPQSRQNVTVYLAALRADFSAERRELFVQEHERQIVGGRLAILAGGLFFVLISLAGVTSYIRADEATKGYYTNRLRLAALTGVGAAGWALYKLVA